ncbi:MAG: nicotinate phosphoribosyltransferase [Myxococcaceae bacterium]|nr:nicotinate phosphoribosyltransferase [Myxococcaceae bacterium]
MGSSLLATDGYKFSMAEAGWPLRRETFYYAHRKGGPQLLPFDVEAELQKLRPVPAAADYAYLASHDYEMGAGFKAAITQWSELKVHALPSGAWFLPREPVFSISGPSALVSWLEPLLLQWNYRIQVASAAVLHPQQFESLLGTVTGEAQKQLTFEVLDQVGVKAPAIEVNEAAYVERVRAQAAELVKIVKDPGRIFEVGLRSATCMAQHLLALEGCAAAGISRTSNVYGAQVLNLVPVGTMGHEHIQRYGCDAAAFRAMCDRRHARSSFLLDTFDTIASGIPAAFALIAERPGMRDSIRYDSGDKVAQYRFATQRAKALGIRPVQILEDGFDAEQTRAFEQLREEAGWAPSEQVYGYGGYLVANPSGSGLTRDKVSAVYKLSQSGPDATMKFADEAGLGKQSVPGRPVLFRRQRGDGPWGMVGQEGEDAPVGYALLSREAAPGLSSLAQVGGPAAVAQPLTLSPATQRLVETLERRKKTMVEASAQER